MNPIDPDYPRMLFHPRMGATTVHSPGEEEALGPGWSRTILAQQPPAAPDEGEEEEDEEPDEAENPPEPVPAEPRKAVKRYAKR